MGATRRGELLVGATAVNCAEAAGRKGKALYKLKPNWCYPALTGRQVVEELRNYLPTCGKNVGEVLWEGRDGVPANSGTLIDINGERYTWPESQVGGPLYPRSLSVLFQARVYPKVFIHQLSDAAFIRSSYWFDNQLGVRSLSGSHSLAVRYLPGRWFSTVSLWAEGYFHWFCDSLPRLHLVVEQLPTDTQFILPSPAAPWMYRSLELLGIAPARCVEFSGRNPWCFERLYYSTPPAMTGDHDPAAIEWVSERLRAPRGGARLRPIYVSRRAARCRRLANEAELLPLLGRYGYQDVVLEGSSFDSQRALFATASSVIGPHGAGLTNVILSEAATLGEVFEHTSLRRCYFTLARALRRGYHCAVANAADGSENDPDIVIADTAMEHLACLSSNGDYE